MMLGVPVPNASLYLIEEVEAALLGQVSEVANQVRNGVLGTFTAVLLEHCGRFGRRGDVPSFGNHTQNPKGRPLG
jgi:hypothetical protein